MIFFYFEVLFLKSLLISEVVIIFKKSISTRNLLGYKKDYLILQSNETSENILISLRDMTFGNCLNID